VFRIALIITALLGGHHHVTITQPNGAGYMTTAMPCVHIRHRYVQPPARIMCVQNASTAIAGHLDIKARFDMHATAQLNGITIHTRRALVYNAHGRLTGWVDWTPGATAVGHVLLRDGFGEEWQQ